MLKSALFTKTRFVVFSFCCLFFLSAKSYGQVRQVHIDTINANNDIYKLSFYSPSHGYIASSGVPDDWVGFTSDSGHTYTKKYITLSNVDYNGYGVNLTFGFIIEGVSAFSQDTLLAYGHYGLVPSILYSTNGGNTFKLVYHNQFNNLQLSTGIKDMVFPQNDNIGYAVDADRILKTTNRGVSWMVVHTNPNSYFDFLEEIDNNNVFAFSRSTNKLLKTTNAGTSWNQLPIPAGQQIQYVNFISPSKGWMNTHDNAVNDGLVYYTTTGGNSWTLKNHGIASPFFCEKMKFVNDSTGYAIAGLFDVYKTTDSGKVWQQLPEDNSFTYLGYSHYDIQCLNENQFWAAGAREFIELSTNGGGTPIPRALFLVDTLNVYSSGIVNLKNYSKPGYQYIWYVNGNFIGNNYHTTYSHFIGSAADTIKLVVTNGSLTDSLIKYQYFYVPPLPQNIAFIPTTGSTGTLVTITGNNFNFIDGVSFGGVPASSFTVISPNKIAAVVGPGATGNVTLSTVYGNFSAPGFTYIAPPTTPPPVVTLFTPISGPVGTSITITGLNFDPNPANNIVLFGAVRANITSATTTQLTGTVPVGSTYAPVSVLNTTTGLSGTSLKPFNVVFADSSNFTGHSFTNVVTYLGVSGRDIEGADMDNDGKPDLTTVISGFRDSVLIFRNTTTGNNFSFTPRVLAGIIPFYSSWGEFDLTDLDGDGKRDIAVVTNYDSIFIYRNQSTPGNISFAPGYYSVPAANGTQEVVAGDLDGDGRPDLAIATFNNSKLSVLRNTSSIGAISFSKNTDYSTPTAAVGVAIGDLDGDGKKEVVTLNHSSSGPASISYFRNTSTIGSIVFVPRVDISISGIAFQSRDIRLADYDGDGKLDVLAMTDNFFNFFRNTSTPGNISFAPVVAFPVNSSRAGAVGGLSGDAKVDIMAGVSTPVGVSVSRNSTTGSTFGMEPFVGFFIPGTYQSAADNIDAVDFNMDGKSDIVANCLNNNAIAIYRNDVGIVLNFSGCEGGNTLLQADLPGTIFQWQMNTGSGYVNVSDGFNFYGANTNTLSLLNIPLAWEGAKFRCLVNGLPTTTNILHVNVGIPVVSISTPNTTVCPYAMVTFTATGIPNGTSPTYRWQINGADIGWAGNSPIMSNNNFNTGDQVRVILGSMDSCYTYHYDTSNVIVLNVIGGGVPSVSVTSPSLSGCSGSLFNFTAHPVNGGASPAYQWKVNGVDVPGATGATFSSVLNNSDYVNVVITPTPTSCTVAPVTSGSVYVTINSSAAPTVSISTPNTTVCQGNNAQFFSTATNAGLNPVYQWKVNGVNAGSNSPSFITAVNNGDQISLVMTSSNSCVANPVANSNVITMSVTVSGNPSVTANATATTICAGQSVTFTMTPINAGINPSYGWKRNDIYVASTQTYTTSAISNGDVFTAVINTSGICGPPLAAISNPITMTVLSQIAPSISISGNTTVNAGSGSQINSTNNLGVGVNFQWQDSTAQHTWANIAGAIGNSYLYVPSATGVKLRCVLTSTQSCVSPSTAISNVLMFTLNPATAIQPVSQTNVKVYPNPVTSILYIDSLDLRDHWELVFITAINGRQNLAVVNLANKRNAAVNVMMLPAGMYLATLRKRNGESFMMRFIKL